VPVLYFARHGETDFNVAHRLQGQYQTSLNALGRQQATTSFAIYSRRSDVR
jgi:probable phosphoglycerate mutase